MLKRWYLGSAGIRCFEKEKYSVETGTGGKKETLGNFKI